jgi:chemosensory pili system protein ChpA (sensor histidine kinase/response regulator)
MGGICTLDSEVSRAFHTLHGSAHMAGVEPIAEVSSALESYVNELIEQDKAADGTTLGLIRSANEQFETILQAINVPEAKIPDWRGLLNEIEEAYLLIAPDDEESEESVEAQDSEPDTVQIIPDDQDEDAVGLEPTEELEEIELVSPEIESEQGQDSESGLEVELLDDEAQVESEPESIELVDPAEESDESQEIIESTDVELEEELDQPTPPVISFSQDQEIEESDVKSADDELISIFLEESVELMDDVDHALVEWNKEPTNKQPIQELQRTLHTLKGGARLAGVQEIGDLSHAFESLIADIERDKVDNSEEVRDFIQSVSDKLVAQIEEVSQNGQIEAADDTVAEINAVISGEKFKSEAPIDEEQDQDIQLEEEELEVEPEQPAEEQQELDEAEAKSEEEEVELEDESEIEDISEEEEQEEDSSDLSQVFPFPEQEPASNLGEEQQVEDVELLRPTRRAGREYLRVNPDVMDKLVNNAGEVSIFRARLEQQSGSMGYSIEEMKNTVDRLREQLRKLDMETEAQILFRYERDREEGRLEVEEFDPLELDRFSTLQQLSRGLMETVGDLANINKILETEQKDTETLLLQQSRITTDLQDGLMRTRMVSFNQLVPRLRRIVRQTCRPLEKDATLKVRGAGMELDRTILDRMTAPLEHLLRNAVSHGIEDPKKRKKKKKSEVGTIAIELSREGNDVVMTVSDDGRGLDFKAIKERAEKKGLLLGDAGATEGDLTQFILEHGFSTADSVSQISGRGVGLDVVVSEIKQLGGTMEINSEPDAGTKFTIYLPLTLAITDALLLKASGDIYAAPYANVESVVRISKDDLIALYDDGKGVYKYGKKEYHLKYLGALLGRGMPNLTDQKKRIPVLLVRAGKHRVAIHVDEIIGHRQIVVKSVGPQLSTIRWITGGTILGDGRVALILDINSLVRADAAMTSEDEEPEHVAPEASGDKIKIMVVDDSITVRKVTGRLLERHGMDVETAKDGVEALAMLQDYHPDIMLLDIEMPRMDGFEVARNMRSSEQLNDIPIIIITSRTGDKHRDHAMELGVKRYLGKPYQEADLLENIHEVLEESKA